MCVISQSKTHTGPLEQRISSKIDLYKEYKVIVNIKPRSDTAELLKPAIDNPSYRIDVYLSHMSGDRIMGNTTTFYHTFSDPSCFKKPNPRPQDSPILTQNSNCQGWPENHRPEWCHSHMLRYSKWEDVQQKARSVLVCINTELFESLQPHWHSNKLTLQWCRKATWPDRMGNKNHHLIQGMTTILDHYTDTTTMVSSN